MFSPHGIGYRIVNRSPRHTRSERRHRVKFALDPFLCTGRAHSGRPKTPCLRFSSRFWSRRPRVSRKGAYRQFGDRLDVVQRKKSDIGVMDTLQLSTKMRQVSFQPSCRSLLVFSVLLPLFFQALNFQNQNCEMPLRTYLPWVRKGVVHG